MTNEREEMLEKSATLYFGPWYRKSPMFEATRRAGCTAYDIYNHMYLPGYYDDPEVEYYALNNDVTLWDVGVERTVEVSGPDADRLIDMITCRDLTKCAVGQGKYMLVTAPDGGIVNDPVLLHVEQNKWWMQLADSDAGLYALGVARELRAGRPGHAARRPPGAGAGTEGREDAPEAGGGSDPRPQVLLVRLVRDPGHPGRDQPDRMDRRSPGSRSTCWTSAAATSSGTPSSKAGEEFNIRPIAPCEARRIEAGIFNYGSDITPDRHAVPRDGPRAPGRGAAAGLHRQGRARAHPSRGRRSQARRHHPGRRRAARRDVRVVARPQGREGRSDT